MLLVHEKKGRPGVFEVAWTWMPFFLADDRELIKSVDAELKELFGGQEMNAHDADALMLRMHEVVIDIVCRKYPIKGLLRYLEAICEVNPEEKEPWG